MFRSDKLRLPADQISWVSKRVSDSLSEWLSTRFLSVG